MERRRLTAFRLLFALPLALALSACAAVDRPPPDEAADRAPAQAYLEPRIHARLAEATPAPPEPGSAGDLADRAAAARDAGLIDTDRWRLAQTHAELEPALALQHFDCPLNTRLSQSPPQALTRLMGRALADASAVATLARARAHRPGPAADDPARRACIRLTDSARSGSSHPDRHAVAGALWGEIFAELAPDQAGALRRRGAAIGRSRAVCAVAWPTDVSDGQALGLRLHQTMQTNAAYRADVAAARRELAAARALGRTNPGCAAEARALAQDP